MKKIEASKLNRNLKEVLDAVAGGTKYEITRYGKVVAKILPPGAREDRVVRIDPPLEIEVPEYEEPVTLMEEVENRPRPTPEQIRQKRRDYLMTQIAKPPKS